METYTKRKLWLSFAIAAFAFITIFSIMNLYFQHLDYFECRVNYITEICNFPGDGKIWLLFGFLGDLAIVMIYRWGLWLFKKD